MPAVTLSSIGESHAPAIPGALPCVAGFYFIVRVCFIFLFFQSNPAAGSGATVGIGLLLFYAAVLATGQAGNYGAPRLRNLSTLRWIFALVMLSLLSVAWTGAHSPAAALAYWLGMAADIGLVLVLLWNRPALAVSEGLMTGAVWGAAALAIVAWCSPATADLRLGDDLFLHPNTLGLELGIATLLAQYLFVRGNLSKWMGIFLGVTLLRTLSKTAILAFLIAEAWYLLRYSRLSRRLKLKMVAGALMAVAAFWGVLTSYLEIYNNSSAYGSQVETLTGRTVLWTAAVDMGFDKPWLGHGLYSFRSTIPALGIFEPAHAHNEAIQLFFEFGIAGVVIAAGVYASFWRTALRAPSSELRALALTLLLFTLVHGLADTVPFGLSFPLWLFSCLALCFHASPVLEEQAR